MYNLVIGSGPLNHFFLTEPSKTIQNVKEYLQQISKDSVEKFIMVYLMFKLT